MLNKPISLNSLKFSDKRGKLIVKEDYFLIFDSSENMEKFIQTRHKFWQETLNKDIVLAPEYNETIDELGIIKIFDFTADFLKVNNILSRTRKAKIVEARRFAIAICVDQGQLITTIANAIDFNHANIIHHRDRFYELCDTEKGYQDRYLGIHDFVMNQLNGTDETEN